MNSAGAVVPQRGAAGGDELDIVRRGRGRAVDLLGVKLAIADVLVSSVVPEKSSNFSGTVLPPLTTL